MATSLTDRIAEFVRKDFTPHFGELPDWFGTNAHWRVMKDLGSELWLDTGKLTDVKHLWTREFTALTTNNTLLNKEIQSGTYDELVPQAAAVLADAGLDERERMLELAFILNATHGLKLVEAFDAFVSVEEHTALAHDVEARSTTRWAFRRGKTT
jgi:transaldolase